MKKFFFFLGLAMMAFSSLFAQNNPKTITVINDNPEYVSVLDPTNYSYTPLMFDTNNSAQLTFGTSAPVNAALGWEIVSIADSKGVTLTYSTLPAGSANIEYDLVEDGSVVYITSSEKIVKNYTIVADNPDHIASVTYNDMSQESSGNGTWIVPVIYEWGGVKINLKPEYKVVGFKDSNDKELGYDNNTPYIASDSYTESTTFYIFTESRDKYRTSTLNVNLIGNPEDVMLTRKNGGEIELTEGEQTIYYDPTDEVPFTLSHTSKDIFRVELNGEKVQKNQYDKTFIINPVDNGQLDITVDYPDINVPVTISYASADLAGLIKEVRVNSSIVEESVWSSSNFTVKAGSNVSIEVDRNNFINYVFTVNGVKESMPLFIDAVDRYDIVVSAERLADKNVTIHCADWKNLEVYYDGTTVTLTGEETTIKVPGLTSSVKLRGLNDYIVSRVYDYATNETINAYQGYVSTEYDINIGVELELFQRKEVAVIYLEAINWDYAAVALGADDTYKEVLLDVGYNEVYFHKNDIPFRISLIPKSEATPIVYLNGEQCVNNYGSYSGLDALKSGDAIMVYTHTVEPCNVILDVAEGVDIEIVKNLIQTVEGTTFTALPGTLVELKGNDIIVSSNGKTIEADENDIFKITVEKDTTIIIAKNSDTGIDNVESESVVDVYTLQGILVKKGISHEDVRALPAGIYIVGNKKVVVK